MKFKLLAVLLFCFTAAHSQIQNQKGNLVLNSGDTLTGIVTHYYDNPSEVLFYSKDIKQVFSAEQLHEIRLYNGEKFVPKFIVEHNRVVLLQVLLESSIISLYRREDNAISYFYVLKGNDLYRLENNKQTIYRNDKRYNGRDNKYIGILRMLMSDRPDLVERLNQIKLNESDLIEVISVYNAENVSYSWKEDAKQVRESNWLLFTQYSKLGSVYGSTANYSFGQMVGLQYYFSSKSRYSIKVSLDYSKYNLSDGELTVKGLGIRYQHDVKKTERYGVYFLLHLADIAQQSRTFNDQLPATKDGLIIMPRISPGLGLEIKPLSKLAAYTEINHVHTLNAPMFDKVALNSISFSLGLKYDFGSISR